MIIDDFKKLVNENPQTTTEELLVQAYNAALNQAAEICIDAQTLSGKGDRPDAARRNCAQRIKMARIKL